MDLAWQRFSLLLLLLLFYCAGPVLVAVLAIRSLIVSPGWAIEDEALLGIVGEIASSPGAYLSIIHQMILPIAAAITAANYASLEFRGIVAWLFGIPLATIFVCLINAAIFNLYGPTDTRGVIAQLFLGTASNLAVYVMLFVGLKLSEPKS